jgi:hypothetical protein
MCIYSDEGARHLYWLATMADPHMFEAYNNLGGHLLVQGLAIEALPLLGSLNECKS